MTSITADERRRRVAVRHRLAPPFRVASITDAARALVCLHATDPATVFLSTWSRTVSPSVAQIETALYDERTSVRMLAMRRTMFVVPVEDAALLHAAASQSIARNERKRNETLVAMLGVADPPLWLREAEAATVAALSALGEATAQELGEHVPALRERVRVNVGKRYEGDIGISSRVLLQLGLEGQVVRGRPRGTWISSQYRWATTEGWLGRRFDEIPEDEAQVEVVRRWLGRFGPGTDGDIRWWTGWTARAVRSALAAVGAVEVDLDGETGFVLPDDLGTTDVPAPWVALLPSLDPTTMGWKSRDWYLGDYGKRLFDTNGNAGPTVWVDGRVVGGWAVRATGEVVTRLFEDIGGDAASTVDAEAARLTEWLSSTPVVPRFSTPFHKELVA